MTQEEILDEAKWTEQLNLESLKRFEQMEMEAKKRAFKNAKRAINGPFIRYHSTAAPLVEVRRDPFCSGNGKQNKMTINFLLDRFLLVLAIEIHVLAFCGGCARM